MKSMIVVLLILAVSLLSLSCKNDEGPAQPAVPDPIASFTYTGDTITRATIRFQNTSQHADSFHWEFGDSTTSADSCPTKVYEFPDIFSVTLTAYNTATGKSSSVTQQLTITPSRMFIDMITITKIPSTKENGFPWDIGSDPDLYVTLNDNASVFITTLSEYWENVDISRVSPTWRIQPRYEIVNWTKAYTVSCWDHDVLEADDLVGTTRSFSVNDLISTFGYDWNVLISNANGTMEVAFYLNWE